MPIRKPLFLNEEGFNAEFDGASVIPLPAELAKRLFVSQGRGEKIVGNHQPITTDDIVQVDPHCIKLKSGVSSLKIYMDGYCWMWEFAVPDQWVYVPTVKVTAI